MSDGPPRAAPAMRPSRAATSATHFVLPPSTPSNTSLEQTPGQVLAVGLGERAVEAFGQLDVQHQRVRAERSYGVLARAAPRRLRRERLVLAEHLDEP